MCERGDCGLHFSGLRWFDAHRHGPYTARKCKTAAELEALGWVLNKRGRWTNPTDVGARMRAA